MRAFLAAGGIVVVVAVGMVVTEAATWPGADSGCVANEDCYCEAFRDSGWATQPVNTASNLAFVTVGLGILWSLARRGDAPRLALTYGWVGVGLGIGSALFHGTITDWGGWADLVSMYAFISLYLAVNSRDLLRWTATVAIALFAVSTVALALIQIPLDQGAGKYVFGALIAAALVTEFALRDRPRRRRILIGAVALFGASFIVWALSRTGAAWCVPESLWQGHALWHIGAAATVALLYRYQQPALVDD